MKATLVAAGLLAVPLGLLFQILAERTHHRPLGAATFSALAVLGFVTLRSVVRRWSVSR